MAKQLGADTRCYQPTYEELKPNAGIKGGMVGTGYQPTYEELKRCIPAG